MLAMNRGFSGIKGFGVVEGFGAAVALDDLPGLLAPTQLVAVNVLFGV